MYKTQYIIVFILLVFFYINTLSQTLEDCPPCCGLSDKKIDIRKGCNYSDCSSWSCKNNLCWPTNPNFYTIMLSKPVYRVFQFDAKFEENCKYDLTGTHWQKLMKISTLPNSDDRSIRLGWRSDNSNKIEIGLYGHVYSEMVFLSLDYFIPINTKIFDYELILSYKGLYAKALSSAYGIKRRLFDKDLWYSTGMTKNAYFEGPNEVGAPHDMRIKVSGVYYDCDTEWDNMSNKGFYYSIFYNGEITTVYASNSIVAPVEPGSGANTNYKTVIIEKGANTTFMSGNRIELLKGFHAKKGSNFKAKIVSGKQSIDTIRNLFSVVVPDSEIERKIISDTLQLSYFNNDILSIDNCSHELILAIYPNPNPGLFNVEMYDNNINEFTIEVTNMMGTRVYFRENVQDGITQIDIKDQSKGIYFVKIQAGDKTYMEKVVYR